METVNKERKLLKEVIHTYKRNGALTMPLEDFKIDSRNYYFRQLIKKGLLKLSFDKTGDNAFPVYDQLYLTDSGLHFFEVNREALKKFVLRSVATPVVVSIITTGLLWLIGWLTGLVHIKQRL